jgi:hypothetical protein
VSLSARSGRAAAAAALVRQGGEGAAGMGGRWKAVRFRSECGFIKWGRSTRDEYGHDQSKTDGDGVEAAK